MNRNAPPFARPGRAHAPDSHRERGFTLIELMIALLVGGVLFALAIPSFKYVTASNRISGEINGLLGDLQFARYQAIKEGLTVSVCAASAGTVTCPTGTSATASTSWAIGWIVVDQRGVVLRNQQAFAGSTPDSLTGTASVSFNRDGFAPGSSASFALHDPPTNVNHTRCIVVTTSGFMQVLSNGQSVGSVTCQ
jgi:type IV fimbrial biogenesis protein FimT